MEENKNNEYEKMIIDVPKNTKAVSVVSIFEQGFEMVMNTHTYSTEDVKNRKIKIE